MTDRPTGPDTFTPRSTSIEDSAPGMVWSTTLSPAEFTQALEDARVAERARIFAALPAALLQTQWWSHRRASGWTSGELAAALVAAIEKELEQ